MPLQIGQWTVNGNGFPGELVVEAVDPAGNLTGTVYGQAIFGFWDEASKRIVFMRKIVEADPTTFQVWTGYLFQDGGVDALAGSFQGFQGSAATAQRNVVGWLAHKLLF